MPTTHDRPSLTPDEARVLELIDQDDLVALTKELVRAPGHNPPGEEAATAQVLLEACRSRGLRIEVTEVAPGRPNISAQLPGGAGPGLLLLGHTDVVPPGEGWSASPWEAGLREGRLYGRGTADMKGGLAACVIALDALRRAGVELSGPVELAALVDEEETGLGIRHYMAQLDAGPRPPFLGCVVAEPTDLQTIIAARGDCYVEITVHGLAAHSGRPDDGRNAIYGAARIVEDLRRWHDELKEHAHPLVGPPTWSVGLLSGGQGTSTVPAQALISADRRLLPGEDAEQVLADVRTRIGSLGLADDGLTVEMSMPMSMPGFETAAAHQFVTVTEQALQESGGPDLGLAGWTAACDGGFIARDGGVPTLVLGPGSVNDQAHRPDESVAVDDLVVAARVYALTALRLLGESPHADGPRD
ncbi:M20 family metallopeptidase [Ornithinimicrobium ciconiae]|uniref:Probable succinyl-diaminopimelate desuccinylase n=1 Tax=Ornithinimicrobium ciconiae TaxID=2594265 RepID=A0A516GCS4_9MICO|nr:M20 family metallopeptidase [Ornithinimicrobium ciconiae]QDO89324.1 M20 family metallopeptidase [Ornithinimicrobium ciconiae]